MSLCSLVYNNKKGINSSNDLVQIMNIGNQLYSVKFVSISWEVLFNAY